MKLEGRFWKSDDSRFWLVEVKALNLVTQGKSRKNALEMIKDAIEMLIEDSDFVVSISSNKNGEFTISSNNSKKLIGLLLKRQREAEGLSLREASARLNSKSPNTYAQYEKGKVMPGLDTIEQLLKALNPKLEPIIKVS